MATPRLFELLLSMESESQGGSAVTAWPNRQLASRRRRSSPGGGLLVYGGRSMNGSASTSSVRNMALVVREMELAEVDLIIDYFHSATPEHLEIIGIDPT